jgi:ADP-ribose pyrophosphatase YjhB (NUDIX family)
MSELTPLGVINHSTSPRKTDYLYRISLKGLVRNENGEILVVKENGRTWWDLPGGGMDHGENLTYALVREMKEEVNLNGDFEYRVITVDDPTYLQAHDFWQVRLIFELKPSEMSFSAGEDGDEIAFIDPKLFKDSHSEVERQIYRYNMLAP